MYKIKHHKAFELLFTMYNHISFVSIFIAILILNRGIYFILFFYLFSFSFIRPGIIKKFSDQKNISDEETHQKYKKKLCNQIQ